MAVQTVQIITKIQSSHFQALSSFARKLWHLGLLILLGVGLWLGLRGMTSVTPPLQPSLTAFMADGGGGVTDVRGVYATAEYFRLSGRDPATFGLNPEQELIFFVIVETHEHDFDLPSPDTWWEGVSLSIDGQGDYRPVKQKTVLASDHHETVAFAFQPKGENGDLLFPDRGALSLSVPDLGDGARSLNWYLPLNQGTPPRQGSGAFPRLLEAFLPLLAGLLVAFSPCFVHMGAYYVPLFGAIQEQELVDKAMKVKRALAAGLFAFGFTIPYAVAGTAVGYAGQFVRDSSLLRAISQPLSFVAGAMVIYFGLQVAGIFRLPFLVRLKLPTLRPGPSSGYLSSALLGMNLAVGCLGCVGGSLFVGMLLYSGAVGSPLAGGLTLFLFGLAANVPFFLAAVTLGRIRPRRFLPLRVTRYIPLVSGVILISLGLIILSGTESALEDGIRQVLRITG